jgi:GMP synthase (glutamine-hydrolysing)
MRVLSIVHGPGDRAALFAPLVEARGHLLDEWSFVRDGGSGRDGYDAVLVFGGVMHADQDDDHPWLASEVAWLSRLLERGTPILGVCLGAQLLARAAGGWVARLDSEPEIGWYRVDLTEAGVADPVLGRLPRSFEALQWHHYTYGVPAEAAELARSARCTQAFRLGESCWAVQFHPEVTARQLAGWLADPEDPPPDAGALREESETRLPRWNELGRELCEAFFDAIEG